MSSLKGRKQSAEHIKNRIGARKYHPLSEETKRKIREKRKLQIYTDETRKKMSLAQKKIGNRPPVLTLESNPNWKGDNVGYGALHQWIRRKLGTPKICWNCKSTNKKRYQWSNISGEYKRDLNDWQRLCAKCHYQFDKHYNRERDWHGRFL